MPSSIRNLRDSRQVVSYNKYKTAPSPREPVVTFAAFRVLYEKMRPLFEGLRGERK